MNRQSKSRNWLLRGLGSSVGQKLILGLTGLGLCGFLVVHLSGNLLMYRGEEHYNDYARFLHANELLPLAEVGLLVLFLLHIYLALTTTRDNTAARPIPYAMKESKLEHQAAQFAPHNTMLFTGLIVLIFLIVHLLDMRFEAFGQMMFGGFSSRFVTPEGETPFAHAIRVLHDPVSAGVYLIGSLFVGYHVWHGFQSAFRSLGLSHPKYTPFLKQLSFVFAVAMAIGFASLPLLFNFASLGSR